MATQSTDPKHVRPIRWRQAGAPGALRQNPRPVAAVAALGLLWWPLSCAGPARAPGQDSVDAGRVALATGETDEAVARFREALEIAPERAPVRTLLAFALLELGRPGEALPLLDASAPADDETPPAELSRAHCRALVGSVEERIASGREREAVGLARTSQACSPGLRRQLAARALRSLAQRERGAGRAGAALSSLLAAFELEPTHPGTARDAAAALLEAGRRREAIEVLMEALAAAPGDGDLIDLMVSALTQSPVPDPVAPR